MFLKSKGIFCISFRALMVISALSGIIYHMFNDIIFRSDIAIEAKIILFIATAVSLILAIGLHEFAHAFTADRFGDPTPRLQGRVTLNPIKHLDPLGTLMIVLVGFGWGKPVQFDPFNLQNPRKEAAIISIAGPLTNLGLALIASAIFYGAVAIGVDSSILYIFLSIFIQLNIVLCFFNLIPVHPLDGFKIVGGILPEKQAYEWYGLERYGMIFLILLILPLGNASMISTLLGPIVGFFMNLLIPSV